MTLMKLVCICCGSDERPLVGSDVALICSSCLKREVADNPDFPKTVHIRCSRCSDSMVGKPYLGDLTEDQVLVTFQGPEDYREEIRQHYRELVGTVKNRRRK